MHHNNANAMMYPMMILTLLVFYLLFITPRGIGFFQNIRIGRRFSGLQTFHSTLPTDVHIALQQSSSEYISTLSQTGIPDESNIYLILFSPGCLHLEDHPGLNHLLRLQRQQQKAAESRGGRHTGDGSSEDSDGSIQAVQKTDTLILPVIWPVEQISSVILKDLCDRLVRIGFSPLFASSESPYLDPSPPLATNATYYPSSSHSHSSLSSSSPSSSGTSLANLFQNLQRAAPNANVTCLYSKSSVHPPESTAFAVQARFLELNDVYLSANQRTEQAFVSSLNLYQFPKFRNKYSNIIPEPVFHSRYSSLLPSLANNNHLFPLLSSISPLSSWELFRSSSLHQLSAGRKDEVMLMQEGKMGEPLAKQIIFDYLVLGEKAFSKKYFSLALSYYARSTQHELSIIRLFPSYLQKKRAAALSSDPPNEPVEDEKTEDQASSSLIANEKLQLFEGEVLSILLSWMLSEGYLSKSVVYHSRSNIYALTNDSSTTSTSYSAGLALTSLLSSIILNPPASCKLQSEVIRRDWHEFIAKQLLESSKQKEATAETANWKYQFSRFRGFLVREAKMDRPSSEITGDSPKPLLFCVHGFGGSIDQFTDLARSLSRDFDAYALDSLGFGWSEKPTISYNQYLWRDQVLEFIARVLTDRQKRGLAGYNSKAKILIAGNSIGGYTATSAAARLAQLTFKANHEHDTVWKLAEAAGLILFNPSGEVVVGQEAQAIPSSASTVDQLFPEYTGIRSEFLQWSGKLLVSLLRPRIEPICKWLYPANPSQVVKSNLSERILRDSLDPGASDVFASGAKLPTPITLNTLLHEYGGPVLFAQGILDPLNNATKRGDDFQSIQSNSQITVERLPLGHCPMDEDGGLVAEVVRRWAAQSNII